MALTLLAAMLRACAPAPGIDASADAGMDATAICPNGPAVEAETCGTPADLRCPGLFASNCDGGFPRVYCHCIGGNWRCDAPVCDASAPTE